MKILKYVAVMMALLAGLIFSNLLLADTPPYSSADQAITAAKESAATDLKKAVSVALSSGFSEQVMLSFANDEPKNPNIAVVIAASSEKLAKILATTNTAYTKLLVKLYPNLEKDPKIAEILKSNPEVVEGIDVALLTDLLACTNKTNKTIEFTCFDAAVVIAALEILPGTAAGPEQESNAGQGTTIAQTTNNSQGEAVTSGQVGPASPSSPL